MYLQTNRHKQKSKLLLAGLKQKNFFFVVRDCLCLPFWLNSFVCPGTSGLSWVHIGSKQGSARGEQDTSLKTDYLPREINHKEMYSDHTT